MPLKERDMETDAAAIPHTIERSKEQAARKVEQMALAEMDAVEDAERKRADEEEKVQKKAGLNAELAMLIVKRAELEVALKLKEPKPEPCEVALLNSSEFVVPPGWHIEGKYLIEDEEMPDVKEPVVSGSGMQDEDDKMDKLEYVYM
ncbi:hypothetical protein DFH08DRAFT_826608 [Mycena albidolilacea]|uniref:Uncharacterized protein n=1 Tax=Mycena albidolilacea TaxID=1033008 RepID=A0AAD6Z0D5_9AGAR|nr:hypothetical protein DFH08DRAFT_826608 [Mycena albidolilacea]